MRVGALVVAVVAALVPLGTTSPTAGAADECVAVSTSWADAPVTLSSPGCLSFAAEPGERVWPAVESADGPATTGEVVDATGASACEPAAGEVGCVLTGEPPYRLLSTSDVPRLAAVRDVAGMTGCPRVTPSRFGTEPADDHPGPGCRRLVAPREARYVVRVDPGAVLSVSDPGGRVVPCTGSPAVCPLPADEEHLLVVDPLGGGFRTAFHRVGGAGCDTRVGAAISDQAVGRLRRAAVDCVTLAHPRGAVVDAHAAAGTRGPSVSVLDARGRPRCVLVPGTRDSCVLAGPTPYRALLTDAADPRYRLVLPRLDDPVGCDRLPRRADRVGQREVTVRLPRGRVAVCLTVPSRFLLGTSLYGVRRLAGDSPATLTVRDTTDHVCVLASAARRFAGECRSYRPVGETTSIVLTTDGSGGRWRLAHRFITRR